MRDKKEDRISTKINCYFLIFNLVVSIIAFSYMVQMVDAQETGTMKAVWADETELYNNKATCDSGKAENEMAKCHVALIEDIMKKAPKFEGIQKEFASNKQKLDYIQKTIGEEIGVTFQAPMIKSGGFAFFGGTSIVDENKEFLYRSDKKHLMYDEKIIIDEKFKTKLKEWIADGKKYIEDEKNNLLNDNTNLDAKIKENKAEIDELNPEDDSDKVKIAKLEKSNGFFRSAKLVNDGGKKGGDFLSTKFFIELNEGGKIRIKSRLVGLGAVIEEKVPLPPEYQDIVNDFFGDVEQGVLPDIELNLDEMELFFGEEGNAIQLSDLLGKEIGELLGGGGGPLSGILEGLGLPPGTTVMDLLKGGGGFLEGIMDKVQGIFSGIKTKLLMGALLIGGAGLLIGMSLRGKAKTETTDKGVKAGFSGKNSGVTIENRNGEIKAVVVSKDDGSAGSVETTGETTIEVNNAEVIVLPGQIAADIPDENTEIVMEGSSGDANPPETTTSIASLSGREVVPSGNVNVGETNEAEIGDNDNNIALGLPLINPSITGKQIADFGRQSIELENQKIELKGNNIRVFTIKTWDRLIGTGSHLTFYSGDFMIVFNNQRILISRVFPSIPKGIRSIKNGLDLKNEFRLQNFGDVQQKGQFTSYDGRITSGDFATKNPGEERLIIAKQREKMYA